MGQSLSKLQFSHLKKRLAFFFFLGLGTPVAFFFFDCARCLLRPELSLVVVRGLGCPLACGILVPQPGVIPMSLASRGGFLATGPPGKSHQWLFAFLSNRALAYAFNHYQLLWSRDRTQVCFYISFWCDQARTERLSRRGKCNGTWAWDCGFFFFFQLKDLWVLSHHLYINMYHLLKFHYRTYDA